jgi:hypothetical protein
VDAGGLRWACGGVGAEERAALATLRPEATLELLFVTARRGGYLADASVSIAPDKAPAKPLALRADGPICLLVAPPGAYRIAAELAGEKRVLRAAVAAGRRAPARLVFTFPAEPWDGIWADPEEKRQAR